jgi:hypothetical protein
VSGMAIGARRPAGWQHRLFVPLLTLIGVAALVLVACGGSAAPSSKAVEELSRVATLKQGEPILVFVYIDG